MSPHTDAGALLKLAERLASMPAAEAIQGPQDWAMIMSALRQTASQGREGGEPLDEVYKRAWDAYVEFSMAPDHTTFDCIRAVVDVALSPPVKTGGEATNGARANDPGYCMGLAPEDQCECFESALPKLTAAGENERYRVDDPWCRPGAAQAHTGCGDPSCNDPTCVYGRGGPYQVTLCDDGGWMVHDVGDVLCVAAQGDSEQKARAICAAMNAKPASHGTDESRLTRYAADPEIAGDDRQSMEAVPSKGIVTGGTASTLSVPSAHRASLWDADCSKYPDCKCDSVCVDIGAAAASAHRGGSDGN